MFTSDMKFTKEQYQAMADLAEKCGEDVPIGVFLTMGLDGKPFPVSQEDIEWGKSIKVNQG